MGAAINNEVDKADSGLECASPSALIGYSRAGKTRALMEIGHELRQEYNRTVIYVTLNDATSYDFEEAQSSSPLESLLARIAYAIAKPEVLAGEPLHDMRKLRFTTHRRNQQPREFRDAGEKEGSRCQLSAKQLHLDGGA